MVKKSFTTEEIELLSEFRQHASYTPVVKVLKLLVKNKEVALISYDTTSGSAEELMRYKIDLDATKSMLKEFESYLDRIKQ